MSVYYPTRLHLPPVDKKRKWGSCVLVACLGIVPQLLQNAIFVEAPYFSDHVPEGNAINALIMFAFVLSNIVAILYALLNEKFKISDIIAISVTLGISLYLAILACLFWDQKYRGNSYGLLILAFLAGGFGNTSVMIFFGYISDKNFPPLKTSMTIGYSLSGVLALLIGLAQNVEHSNALNFSPTMYFIIIATAIALLSLSFILFELYWNNSHYSQIKVTRHIQDSEVMEMVSANDLLLPEGMDDIFTVPLASLRDINIQASTQLKYRPQKRNQQLNAILPLFVLMSVISALVFYVPGSIPYQTDSDKEYLLLNAVFLIFPALGAALATLLKIYYVYIIALIEVIIFIWMEIPSFEGSHYFIPAPFWLLLCQMILFCTLSGYLNTMIFYSVIKRIHPGGRFSQDLLNRWIALLSQGGALLGSTISLICVYSNVYFDTPDDDDSITQMDT